MLTFSQLVDSILEETLRPDRLEEVKRYLNATIRECHSTGQRKAIFFSKNMVEDQLTADSETAFYWTIPNSPPMQRIITIRYDSVYDVDGQPVYPKRLLPGPVLRDHTHYYYQSGDRLYFSGYGGVNALISLAYYSYLKGLVYYPAANRPASWNEEDGTWTYHTDYDSTAELQEQARNLVQNWMIRDWDHVLKEGTKAKLLKAVGEDQRAATSYSLYEKWREDMAAIEFRES